MKEIIVAPSILSANFLDLKNDLDITEKSLAKWLHFDVMDGHFVPNISFGSAILRQVKGYSKLFMDVHIMISDPLKYAKEFIDAGADILTFHYEALKSDEEILQVIKLIKSNNCKVGISIKPDTKVEKIFKYLNMLDLVLIMSVEPGFGGQSFMDNSLNKIKELRLEIDSNKYNCLIQVDGGINDITSYKCRNAGADVLVAGSYLYGKIDFSSRVKKLMGI
ncbi:MAG: ribulose-phosphate 3-epimerase [Bacilli bacterium]|nr:ribulose-phosphate 3-epimerase [Bacilli bacterium]